MYLIILTSESLMWVRNWLCINYENISKKIMSQNITNFGFLRVNDCYLIGIRGFK